MDGAQVVSPETCYELSAFVHKRFGMFFPPERHNDLLRAVSRACDESGFSDPQAYVDWVLAALHSDKELEPLVTSLTIGETYFFRDPGLFAALREVVVPQRVRQAREAKTLRVWSAGCSTGEEPYSIAMLLDHYGLINSDWSVDLLATDVNVKSLRHARKGIYSRWSFRGLSEPMQQRYFDAVDDHHWQLKEVIRQRVDFSYLNLAAPPFRISDDARCRCDIILCRNVLMYFSRELREQILAELTRMLDDGGWLVVSPSEAGLVAVDGLHSVHINGMVLHRKGIGEVTRPVSRPVLPKRVTPREKSPPKVSVPPVKAAKAAVKPAHTAAPPDEPLVSVELCADLVEQGAYAQAMTQLENLLAQCQPDRREQARINLLLAKCHANIGHTALAQENLEQALRLDQMNPAAHYLSGVIALEEHDVDQARHSLERALYLDEDYIMAQLTMGMLQGQCGDVVQQKKSFARIHLLLDRLADDEVIPDSGGMTVAHLRLSLKN
ncbi:CheR family methyltransferase [Desulfuromonas acetoxidans]|uniref:CheR family methyltransferase n=1 Tax=Desulfuromonas acetoxidans TaxID=891 RepID=UPI00292F92C9|nr:CheR family methyltransferase [Desulfuromonas acetoxidans]